MITAYPLTVYYDASCRLCNSEMQNIKLHDRHDNVILIDCSVPEFDDAPFEAIGITRETMMKRLHLQDAEGNWLIGVTAFETIYRTVGMPALAALWGHPISKPWVEKIYPWVADNRFILSKLGFPVLFEFFAKHAAKKAEQRSRICTDGYCQTEAQSTEK